MHGTMTYTDFWGHFVKRHLNLVLTRLKSFARTKKVMADATVPLNSISKHIARKHVATARHVVNTSKLRKNRDNIKVLKMFFSQCNSY